MRKLFLFCTVAFIALSCGKSEPTITIDVANLNGEIVLSYQLGEGAPVAKQTIIAENGKATIKHDNQFHGLMMLTADGESRPFASFLVDTNSPNVLVSGDLNNKVIVSGSTVNELYEIYSKSNKTNDKAKFIEFLTANPSSIASAYVLSSYFAYISPLKDLREYRVLIDSSLNNSPYMIAVDKNMSKLERVEVGQKFIDIDLPTPDGKNVSLSSLLAENKYVLLDFWASWCSPCRKENPNVVAAYNKYKKDGFTVYGVSLDRPAKKDAWVKAIADDKLEWTNVSDLKGWDCVPANQYAVRGIPANFLIASDGTIVAANIKKEDLHTKLAELLKTK